MGDNLLKIYLSVGVNNRVVTRHSSEWLWWTWRQTEICRSVGGASEAPHSSWTVLRPKRDTHHSIRSVISLLKYILHIEVFPHRLESALPLNAYQCYATYNLSFYKKLIFIISFSLSRLKWNERHPHSLCVYLICKPRIGTIVILCNKNMPQRIYTYSCWRVWWKQSFKCCEAASILTV